MDLTNESKTFQEIGCMRVDFYAVGWTRNKQFSARIKGGLQKQVKPFTALLTVVMSHSYGHSKKMQGLTAQRHGFASDHPLQT